MSGSFGENSEPGGGNPFANGPGGGNPFETPRPAYDNSPFASPTGQPHQQTAGAGIRLLAQFIDGLIFIIPSFIIGIATAGSGFFTRFVVSVVLLAITMAYFVGMESIYGKTLGKMVTGLEVRGSGTNGFPTQEEALKRNAYRLLGLVGVLPVIGLLQSLISLGVAIYIGVTINSDGMNRGWHDHFAGTTVVKA